MQGFFSRPAPLEQDHVADCFEAQNSGRPAIIKLHTPTTINHILFLTLKVFSATGGIEKVCRVAGKAIYEFGLQQAVPVRILSMHDDRQSAEGNIYFPAEIFAGYSADKVNFILDATAAGSQTKVVILSHINLLVVGWLIKRISPSTQVILMAHGIEIWQPLSKRKKMMLNACDRIVSVSSFTSEKIKKLHGLPPEKCTVLNNCIDPYLKKPTGKKRSDELMSRYGFKKDDNILLTLTRLTEKDRYKGYVHVLEAMAGLVKENGNLKYLLAGSYDAAEKNYVQNIIDRLELRDSVILTGFIPEEELPAHFSLADIYVMPSIKEGFGIVFVEAMFYGVPVIAGNADGSSDALLQGELGVLIEPENPAAIATAIKKILKNPDNYVPRHELLMAHFGYEAYKRKLNNLLSHGIRKNFGNNTISSDFTSHVI